MVEYEELMGRLRRVASVEILTNPLDTNKRLMLEAADAIQNLLEDVYGQKANIEHLENENELWR